LAEPAKTTASRDAELLGLPADGAWGAASTLAGHPKTTNGPADESDLLADARRHNAKPWDAAERPGAFRAMPARLMSRPPSFPILARREGSFRMRITQGQPILTPAASGECVFVGGGFNSRTMHCLDAATGQTRWTVGLSDNGPSPPAYADGAVIFNTESCTTYALDAQTGQVLWSSYLGDSLVSMPSVAGGCVLVCYPESWRYPRPVEDDRTRRSRRAVSPAPVPPVAVAERPPPCRLAALDARTGKPRWSKWIDQHVISAPIVFGNDVYATTLAGTLYKLRLSDGEILIARRCGARSAPVVAGDAIFVTARSEGDRELWADSLVVMDRTTGELLETRTVDLPSARRSTSSPPSAAVAPRDAWVGQLKPMANLRPTSAVQEYSGPRLLAAGGRLFGCLGVYGFAMASDTGERLWGLDVAYGKRDESFVSSPIASAGGRLFLATTGGDLLQIEPTRGAVERRFPLKASVITEPIVEHGRVFLGTRDGQLLCIDLGDERLTGWNQWGGTAARCVPDIPYPLRVPVAQTEIRAGVPSAVAASDPSTPQIAVHSLLP
jgi:outer membrane protein assembly factor BamB